MGQRVYRTFTLHLAYVKVMYHYTQGELKGAEKSQDHANEYLEKSRQVGLRIAIETLRALKVPKRAIKPDPDESVQSITEKLQKMKFESLIKYQQNTKQETIVLQIFRNITNVVAVDMVEWVQKTDLGTPTGRDRSARLLSTALGLYSVMDRHFQQTRSKGITAPPEELGFTDREQELRELMRKTLEQLSAKPK